MSGRDVSDLYRRMSEEYGHAYLGTYYDEDILAVGRLFLDSQYKECEDAHLLAVTEDNQDEVQDWWTTLYEAMEKQDEE